MRRSDMVVVLLVACAALVTGVAAARGTGPVWVPVVLVTAAVLLLQVWYTERR